VPQTLIVVVARAPRSPLGHVAANRGALREWIAALCEWIAACLEAQPCLERSPVSSAALSRAQPCLERSPVSLPQTSPMAPVAGAAGRAAGGVEVMHD
jgi:hypothetical protein